MRKDMQIFMQNRGGIFKVSYCKIRNVPFCLHFTECFSFLMYVLKIHLFFLFLLLGHFEPVLCVMGWLKNVSDRCVLPLLWTKYSKHVKLFQLPSSPQEYDKLVG